MNTELPKDLAGWQNVRECYVCHGDMLINNRTGERCYAVARVGRFVDSEGNTVDDEWRVYRKIETPKQDHMSLAEMLARTEPVTEVNEP